MSRPGIDGTEMIAHALGLDVVTETAPAPNPLLDGSAFAIDLAIRSHPTHPMHGWDGVEWDGEDGVAVCRCGARLSVKRGGPL